MPADDARGSDEHLACRTADGVGHDFGGTPRGLDAARARGRIGHARVHHHRPRAAVGGLPGSALVQMLARDGDRRRAEDVGRERGRGGGGLVGHDQRHVKPLGVVAKPCMHADGREAGSGRRRALLVEGERVRGCGTGCGGGRLAARKVIVRGHHVAHAMPSPHTGSPMPARPADSGSPNTMLAHWTACPAAPLHRLSMAPTATMLCVRAS